MGTKTFDGRGQGRGEVARFTFGKHDLFWQYRINPTLRAIIDTGNYVYLDGRICRDVYEPPMNMAVAVCIGLHLLPFESRKLLSRLGYTLDGNSPIIRAYQLLIDVFYNEEVCDCNTFLVEKGLKPLTKETE